MNKQEIEMLYEQSGSLYQVYDELQKQRLESPISPKKPILATKHTSEDIAQYAKDYAEYEILYKQYDELKKQTREHNDNLDDAFEAFCEELSGYNDLIPSLQELAKSFLYDAISYSGVVEKYHKLTAIVEFINKVKNV